MNIFQALFKTSIGKKVLMAVTGLILIGFVMGHLVGNLQLFAPPEKINAYAHLLQSLGPALWGIRAFLLIVLVLHIWTAVMLVKENMQARPSGYEGQQTLKASYASRTMRYSGVIVFAFIIYHILHFTAKTTHGESYYPLAMLDGHLVPDVHSMMVLGFQQPLVAGFYIIAIALLSWHLNHGIASMFQSIGLRSRTWGGFLNKAAFVISALYFLGNAAIVGAVYTGQVTIQNENLQLARGEICSLDCRVCETRNAN